MSEIENLEKENRLLKILLQDKRKEIEDFAEYVNDLESENRTLQGRCDDYESAYYDREEALPLPKLIEESTQQTFDFIINLINDTGRKVYSIELLPTDSVNKKRFILEIM